MRGAAAGLLAGPGLLQRAEAAPAEEEMGLLEKTDLFEAGAGGYAVYRIPGIVAAPGGALLAYCEARKEAGSDWGRIDVLLRRSADGGRTWDAPQVLVDASGLSVRNRAAEAQGLGSAEGAAAHNPVMIADAERGAVHFLYGIAYARCYYRRSDDGGRTFTDPVDITAAFEALRPRYDWKVIAVGPGHGIRLRSGRLLAPVWLSLGTGGHAHRPSVVSTLYSDDGGRSWQCGDLALEDGRAYTYADRPGARTFVNPSETAAVQLQDGRVMLNARTESPELRRAVAYSPDGAGGWTAPVFDEELYEPVCFGSLARLSGERPGDGRARLLFVNPDSRAAAALHGPRARRNLTVKLSYDEGETWPVRNTLEPGLSAYADLAVGPDHRIFCLYERGGAGGDAYRTEALTLARFDLAWLTDGKDRL